MFCSAHRWDKAYFKAHKILRRVLVYRLTNMLGHTDAKKNEPTFIEYCFRNQNNFFF